MADALVASILALRHPAYEAFLPRWQLAETRLRAGRAAAEELAPFPSEVEDGQAHTSRKERAVCLPLMHETAREFVDSVSRQAPRPGEAQADRALSLGTLGSVRPELGGFGEPTDDGTGITSATRAELLWTNADGTGDDGASFETWIDGVQRRAMATGFRWVGVEAPPRDPERVYTAADDDTVLRPYAVEFSPAATPYWLVERGTLQVLHVVTTSARPKLNGSKVEAKDETEHLVYIRAGYDGFGDRFKAGGWWRFKPDGDERASGAWTSTGGAIPFCRFFYERDPQSPTGARAGLDAVGSIQTGLMDLESAARSDAHVRSSGVIVVAGVSKEAHKAASAQLAAGSRFVGLEAPPASTGKPAIHDMGSVSASGAVTAEIDRLFAWAKSVASLELTSGPNASGRARETEYEAKASPRLAHMGRMREEAVAFLLRFFELRWGGPGTTPTSAVRYPRRYSLASATERLVSAIDALSASGITSPTLAVKAAEAALSDSGVALTTGEKRAVEDEARASATVGARDRALDDILT